MPEILDPPKIDVHAAVAAAAAFLKDTIGKTMELRNLQLEEIEMSDGGGRWLVTLGYDDLAVPLSQIEQMMRTRPPARKLKVVHVEAETGKAVAIKNR